jgi:hypothetical protein
MISACRRTLETQRAHHPDRLAPRKAAHVGAADQRDVLTELGAVGLDQAAAMRILFPRHVDEHLGRSRIGLRQPGCEIGIDARVLLLQGDRQRQDFPLGQLRECFHAEPRLNS